MPRTEYLKPYIDRIDALNDQLWYFLFTSEELNRQLDNYSPSEKEKYTTELFAANKHAFRIRIKVSALEKHQDDNKRITKKRLCRSRSNCRYTWRSLGNFPLWNSYAAYRSEWPCRGPTSFTA